MTELSQDRSIDVLLVLAGGRGRRLGGPKAWLDWKGQPLLLRVLEQLAPLAEQLPLVAGSPGMDLPPGRYARVDDLIRDAGPLSGLTAGLAAVERADPEARVAVAACDGPFADPRLFHFLARVDREVDVVLPGHAGRLHPLAAVWRARSAGVCRQALERGERRVRAAVDDLAHRIVPSEAFPAGLDPDRILLNLNDRSDLLRALALQA